METAETQRVWQPINYSKPKLFQFIMTNFEEGLVLEALNIGCESEKHFAQVIGCIEEIIVDENFINLQNSFMEEHWKEFENKEENKLEYMEIFKKYLSTVEKYIEEQLLKHIDHFSMTTFERELKRKQNELDGEIFDILSTFSDFNAFKNMFLDYKAMKEGKTQDLSKSVLITKYFLEI